MKNIPHRLLIALFLLIIISFSMHLLIQHRRKHTVTSAPSAEIAAGTRFSSTVPITRAAKDSFPEPTAKEQQTKARVKETFAKMPIYFVENRGQMDGQVGYYVQGRDQSLYFTPQDITFALTSRERTSVAAHPRNEPPSLLPAAFRPGLGMPKLSGPELGLPIDGRNAAEQQTLPQRWIVKLDFVGANPQVRMTGRDETGAVISYFKVPQAQWRTGLKSYATLVYEEL